MKNLKDYFISEAKKMKEPGDHKKYNDKDGWRWLVEKYIIFGPGDLIEEGGIADEILHEYDEDGYMSQKIGEGYYDDESGILCGCSNWEKGLRVYLFKDGKLYR